MTPAPTEDADLAVTLDIPVPASLPVGTATAIFCYGTCFHRRHPIERLEIVVEGARHPTTASGMPRPDRFRELHPDLGLERPHPGHDPRSSEDPELRSYRSGFWATVPIEAHDRPGTIEVRLEATLANGGIASGTVATIEVVARGEHPAYDRLPAADGELIAICMATFDPEIELFRSQIDSLRAQTDRAWTCLISDDCSTPERFDAITEVISNDPRFVVSRSPRRLGFYRNFERALQMVPAEAELVALCDQDDRWYPDKLEVLRGALGKAQLVYSDQRLVDSEGRLLRETLWRGRRNNYTNFASMLIANTIVGAASLFRRRVIELALPFPEGPGWQFHDHWLAVVALASGDVAYVDRPLYDYVQHADAVVGKVAVEAERGGRGESAHGPPGWGPFARWRATYFRSYLQLELQAEVVLARCSAELTRRKRRAARLLVAAGRTPLGLAWLALRWFRRLFGRTETLGTEAQLLRGVLWRRLIVIRAGRRRLPGRTIHDASIPAFDVDSFGYERLKRWLASA